MSQMPSLFISHGGPNVVTDPSEAHDFLTSLSSLVEKPKAIVMVSAHFEAAGPAVVTDPSPGMIYDFGGFAPELHTMVYPAPGMPDLAERIGAMLTESGFAPKMVAKRGYDHGAWNPLILGFPDADVPVVQVSIDPERDAAWHVSMGQALAGLREEGILVIGSGHITHNLRAVFGAMRHGLADDPAMTAKVDAFTDWIAARVADGDMAALVDWRAQAPFVADNHPTDEHLMPFFVALGAGGLPLEGRRVHASRQYGFFAWDSYLFG